MSESSGVPAIRYIYDIVSPSEVILWEPTTEVGSDWRNYRMVKSWELDDDNDLHVWTRGSNG